MYGQIYRITVETVKEYSKQEAEYRIIDNANIMKSLLTKQFPPERVGGLVNLIAATRPSAPDAEIQKALVNLIVFTRKFVCSMNLHFILLAGLHVWFGE